MSHFVNPSDKFGYNTINKVWYLTINTHMTIDESF